MRSRELRPFVSLLLGVEDVGHEVLTGAIRSVLGQSLPEWELLTFGASDEISIETLRDFADLDDRLQVLDLQGSAAQRAQSALELAQGEFLSVLPAGSTVGAEALAELQRLAARTPGLDVAYTDEAFVTGRGTPEVVHKPAWSPERLRGEPYLGHLWVLRTSLAREVGGFRAVFEDAHELDLLLRVAEAARIVQRIPVVGVTRHAGAARGDERSWRAGVGAVQQHLDRVGVPAKATPGPVPGTYRIDRRLPTDVSVSVVIPTQGHKGLVWGEKRSYVVAAVRSILADTEQRNCEIVVVHNQDTPSHVLEELRTLGPRVRVDGFVGAFNFARMCNRGATVSGGQVLVLMDERSEVGSVDFVGQLASPLLEHGVGLTGPQVLASDGTVLEGGLAVFQDLYEPLFRGDLVDGANAALVINRECSAVGATCLALTREVFEEVGGLNERHPKSAHVDLAMKIAALGLRRLWMAAATLRHFPPPGRETRAPQGERRWLATRWAAPDLDEFAPTYGARQLRRAAARAAESRARQRARRSRASHA